MEFRSLDNVTALEAARADPIGFACTTTLRVMAARITSFARRPAERDAPCRQPAELLLQRVPACPGQLDDVADADAAMRAGVIEDAQRQVRQARQHDLLALDLLREPRRLLMQRAQEVDEPRLPIGRSAADRSLRLPQGEIVALLALPVPRQRP